MGLLDALRFGPAITYPPTPPADQPGIYASPEEWAAYRRKQAERAAIAAQFEGTNKSGMTPSQMEAVSVLQETMRQLAQTVETPISGPENAPYRTEGVGRPVETVPAEQTPNPQKVREDGILGQAFPEVFRQSPPTGQVNTKGGVDRVNARTAEHGVTAIMRDGKIYMTNINPDGSVNRGTGSPNSVLGDGKGTQVPSLQVPDANGEVNSVLSRLKATTSYQEAVSLMGNLNGTLANISARMEGDAIKFAEGKYRVPELERMLEQSVQTDMQSYGWYPGIGDSPPTAKLRAELNAARSSASAYSKNYLASNQNYSALRAAEATAKLEFDRVKATTLREDNIKDNLRLRSDAERASRAAAAQDVVDTLGPEGMQRIALLNPALVQPGENGKPDPISIARFMQNKQAMEAISAVGDQLPVHAMEGNPYAITLVARSEAGLRTEQETQDILKRIVTRANSATFLKEYTQFKHKGNATAAKEEMQALQSGLVDQDTNKKRAAYAQKLQGALDMERAEQTVRMLANVKPLLESNPLLKDAVQQSISVTGNATLENVLNAYLKDSPSKEERIKRVALFRDAVIQSVNSRPPSLFGRPDVNVLTSAIISGSITFGDKAELAMPEFGLLFRAIGTPGTTLIR